MYNEKINNLQAIYLCIILILGTAIIIVPSAVVQYAEQDAWISSLLATLLSLIIAWVTVKLSFLYPGLTLIEFIEVILGRWLGKAVGMLYIYFFAHNCAWMVRHFGNFLTTAFMPNTPIIVFHIVLITISAYCILQGLEVLARVNEIFLPVILISILIIFLFTLPEMDFANFLPVFEASAVDIFKGSLVPLGWRGEIITLAMFIPFLNNREKAGKIAFVSILATGFILLAIIIGSFSLFGTYSSLMTYPVLNVSRLIGISKFLDRLDPLILVTWVMGGFVKITFFYFITVLGTAQLLKLKNYRPLTLPIGLILAPLSLVVVKSTVEDSYLSYNFWPFYALIFELVIPISLLIIALIRKRIINTR